jgi:hypothetical protein
MFPYVGVGIDNGGDWTFVNAQVYSSTQKGKMKIWRDYKRNIF